MIASYSSFPQTDSSMCRIGGVSPLRNKQRVDHQRHNSEYIERPRPISISAAPPTMLHIKRSSIYVSDASILLQHKNPILSPTLSTDPLPAGERSEFVDHYAALELPPNASIDDVKAAFRRLRLLYFTTNPAKYRLAQAAFDVLANPAARQDYDAIYRPPNAASLAEVMDQSKRGRSDSAHSDQAAMPVVSEEDEIEAAQNQDVNWRLKHHRRLYEPVIGTQPYASYIPILSAYDGVQRHPHLGCRRPVYLNHLAVNSRPN
ncbi:hypothetical protein CC86DRAFT_367938 [Ophiobolus disseminans]|uniref:J domain-containing protein n=1 Tax=Ophiobolus disseminans TaxID=1469910 RepID=A0A6A7A9T2_9PLEO|nr:hypothetical protein CC86DRAFT_367938 [Ophiobolus disseminans]